MEYKIIRSTGKAFLGVHFSGGLDGIIDYFSLKGIAFTSILLEPTSVILTNSHMTIVLKKINTEVE